MSLGAREFADVKATDLELVGTGLCSHVVLLGNTNLVAKIPGFLNWDDVDVERQIYERLPEHPYILRYYNQVSIEHLDIHNALVFEYHPKGDLEHYLDRMLQHPSRQQWPLQAVSAVEFIHSKNIIHGDLALRNFLLTDQGNLTLCDFAGSGIDDTLPTVSPSVRYSNPLYISDYPSRRDDIFALGTVLYELARGERLYKGRSDAEVMHHLRQGIFPSLTQIESPLRDVIQRCWQREDYTARNALDELGSSTSSEQTPTSSDAARVQRGWLIAMAVVVLAVHIFRSSPATFRMKQS